MATKHEKRNYRDKMFLHLFGQCKNARENFLSLYNAIHNSELKIEDVHIEPYMIENIAHNGLYNDVSMLIDNKIIILVEHQSTVNVNMPLRCLEYVTELYSRMVQTDNKYNSKIISLPAPEFYVMYNGKTKVPEESTIKLSDAFCKNRYSNILGLDLVVKVFNIKKEDNPDILKRSKILNGYSTFVNYVEFAKKQKLTKPIKYAIDKCIKENILTDYFSQLSKEEREMIFTNEYDYETDIRVKTKEAFEDGEQKARLEDAVTAVKKLNITPETAAQTFDVDLSELMKNL